MKLWDGRKRIAHVSIFADVFAGVCRVSVVPSLGSVSPEDLSSLPNNLQNHILDVVRCVSKSLPGNGSCAKELRDLGPGPYVTDHTVPPFWQKVSVCACCTGLIEKVLRRCVLAQ